MRERCRALNAGKVRGAVSGCRDHLRGEDSESIDDMHNNDEYDDEPTAESAMPRAAAAECVHPFLG